MVNGILSLIQPNGSDKFNLRAESVFYFQASTNTTGEPGSGYVGIDESNEHALVFQHDNIVSVNPGMIIAFESPTAWDYKNVIIKNGGTLLSTNQLVITHSVDNRNGCLAFHKGEFYIMILDYNNNFRVINSHLVETISHNGTRPVTGKAVYDFVTEKIANPWKYVVSDTVDTTPNVTYLGNNPGTLVASADTEYKIYLVRHSHGDKDFYDEWITVNNGTVYSWEKIGNTDIDMNGIIESVIPNITDHVFTPAGTVSKPTFTGTQVGTTEEGAHTHKVTATGNVSSTFTGIEGTVSGATEGHNHKIDVKEIKVKGSVTAAGSVSQPTFTGSESTTSTEPAHKHEIAAGAISVSGTLNPSNINITAGAFTGTEATISMGNVEAIPTTQEEHTHTIASKGITISGSVTAAGSVSQPTFTGSATTIESKNTEDIESTSTTHNHSIAASKISVSSTYTPEGDVSTPTITVTPSATVYSMTGVGNASSYTVSGEVLTLTPSTVPTRSSVTFTGSSTAPTFTGKQATITSKNSEAVSISGGAHTHKLEASTVKVTSDYTPTGTVSQPTFTGSSVNFSGQNKDAITISGGAHGHNIASKAIALSTKYTPAGTIANPTVTTTSITVTSTNAAAINTGDAGRHSHTVTAAGTVSKPTFTGSAVTVTSTNETEIITSSDTANVAIKFTPAGTVTSTFTGSEATTDSAGAHAHKVTPEGTVSQPTFSGTQVTLEHTPQA